MTIRIDKLQMAYRDKEVESINLSYRIAQEEGGFNGRGSLKISPENYNGSIESLEGVAKEHFSRLVEEMNIEIRSTNMTYKQGEIEYINVVFTGKADNRELDLTGNFTINANEYNENNVIEDLEALARENLLNKINAPK